ncbi:epoxide hydrolase N-terminal domain-containing protein [Pseudomonas baltica]|uniref:epoxide hydrolase N-terminal domain-containing protein n=1 Tax=Pseudomonas baltica TaxID=2762576 RepID=UPI0028982029|nr:epoxide hydrolase N-terminal domain-containing protein [Pseudomonas baltica]
MLIEPVTLDFPQADLDDLRERLARTRLPGTLPGQGWSEGMDLDVLSDLLGYWATTFDWPAQQARLNELPHYQATIGEQRIHFIHQPGTGPAPLPLVLSHGWPGSFLEMGTSPRWSSRSCWRRISAHFSARCAKGGICSADR